MANPLRAAIMKKLNIGERRLYQLLAEREEKYLISRPIATLLLARDSGVSIARYASDEETEAIRQLERGRTPEQPISQATATPARQPRAPLQGRTASTPRRPRSKDNVFVIHGRDEAMTRSMYDFLRALHLRPMEWGELMKATAKATPSIPEVVEKALDEASAVVVVMTPDDDVALAGRLREGDDDDEGRTLQQPRPNVFYEAGMAVARHPLKTIFVTVGKVKPFSDIAGFHVTRLNNKAVKRQELVGKLATARGAPIDTGALSHWLDAGDFEIKET